MTLEIPGYKILSTLGKGGMATVYLAEHEIFRRKVALKVMAHGLTDDSSFGERFMREARIVSQLVHPNIVTVYDVGVHEGNYYLSMEFIDGKDLKHARQNLSLEQKIAIILDIAKALEYAGNKGYVHRDIKPENIMLYTDDSRAVLTDFGIARAAEQEISVTQTGTAIGTPHYMSPEQAKGQPVDIRSDIYGLGVVFYLLLAGCVPYDAESAVAIGIKHITEPIPELPEGLESLQPIIDRMMAKLPQQRYQKPAQLVQDLRRLDVTAVVAAAERAGAQAQASLHNASADAPTVISPRVARAGERVAASRRGDTTAIKAPNHSQDPTPYLVDEPFEPDESDDSVVWPWLAGILVLLAVVGGVYYSQNSEQVDGWLAERRAQWESWIGQATDAQPNQQTSDNASLAGGSAEPRPEESAPALEPGNNAGTPAAAPTPSTTPSATPPSATPEEGATSTAAVPDPQVAALRQRIQDLEAQVPTDASKLAPLVAAWRELQTLSPETDLAGGKIAAVFSAELARIKQLAMSGDSESARIRLSQLQNIAPESLTDDLAGLQTLIEEQRQVAQWLAEAEEFFAADALTRPAGANASARYEQILELQPDNASAREGLAAISARLAELASAAYTAEQLDRAANLLAKSLEIDPGNQQALALRETVAQTRSAQRNSQIDALLQQAESRLREADYFQPPAQNAYQYFRQVLDLQSDNTAAQSGITRTFEEFEKHLLNLIAEDHFQVVRDRLQVAMALAPTEERLKSLQSRMEDAIAQKVVASQPRVVDIVVTGLGDGELPQEQPASIQADRSISVSFRYENFNEDTSVIQAILMDGARTLRIAQVPVILTGPQGSKTFRIDRPVERYSPGLYIVELYFREKRLATHEFQVE